MNNFKSKLQKLQAEYNKAEQVFMDASNKHFKEAVEDIFIQHPDLQEFSFTMYTPAYNDGSPCHFCVNYDYVIGEDENEDEDGNKKITDEMQKTISKNLSLFPDSFYERTYGTATRLTCYRNGDIKQDYYDCGY